MNPPASVKVGPYTYAVVFRQDDHGPQVWGRTRERFVEIRVDANLPSAPARVTLLHEVAHAVHNLAGVIDFWPKSEEQQVTVTAPIWLMVLRDNPDLVRFLTADDG